MITDDHMEIRFRGGPLDGDIRTMRRPLMPTFEVLMNPRNVHREGVVRRGAYRLHGVKDLPGARIYVWAGEK